MFAHQYSSLSKAVANLASNQGELKRVEKLFQAKWLNYFPPREVNHFQTDVVNIFREYSGCLPDRQYRHKANQLIAGNKPVGIGYPLSSVNLADFASGWSLPFELRRVKSSEDEIEVAAKQIKAICEREEFASSLNINACDSSYGVAKYISVVSSIENLVNVIRLRHGIKVFESDRRSTKGAKQIYRAKYYLTEESGVKKYKRKEREYHVKQVSIYDKSADEASRAREANEEGQAITNRIATLAQNEDANKAGGEFDEGSRV